MKRRLDSLRRRNPRTPADPAASEPTPETPVAWAAEEPAADAEPPSTASAPDGEPTPAADGDPEATAPGAAPEEPETTVFSPVEPQAAPEPEPETTVFPAVPPAGEGPEAAPGGPVEEPTRAGLAPAPQDAVAAPPLEVLSVQPDGTVLPAPDPSAPAGTDPAQPAVPDEPGFRVRGRLRRRLRYLRRVRELGLRDLGGLVFDLHRFSREGEALVAGKLAALGAVDDELRRLEEALDDRRELVVLREPGLAACPRCAALHGSDANFCPNCGLPFGGGAPVTGMAPPVGTLPPPPAPGQAVTASHPRLDAHGRPLP